MKANGQSYPRKHRLRFGLKKNSPGFTMLEGVIVVAIIAVVSAAAVPAVNSFFRGKAVQSATHELYADIQLARMRAAKNNWRCRILFNQPAANQYTIKDYDNNGAFIGDFKIGDLTKFRDSINFCPSPWAPDPNPLTQIEFFSQGILNVAQTAPANSNRIYLTNKSGGVYYQIVISLAGGTSIDRWEDSLKQWR